MIHNASNYRTRSGLTFIFSTLFSTLFSILFLSQTLVAQTGVIDTLDETKYFYDANYVDPKRIDLPVSYIDTTSLVVSANNTGNYVGMSIGSPDNKLGIGLPNLTPAHTLHVRTVTEIPQLDIYYNNTTTGRAKVPVLYVDKNGNVGVGTKAASEKFHIVAENYKDGASNKKYQVEIDTDLRVRSDAIGIGEKAKNSTYIADGYAPYVRTTGTVIGKENQDDKHSDYVASNASTHTLNIQENGLYLINISAYCRSETTIDIQIGVPSGTGAAPVYTYNVNNHFHFSWSELKELDQGNKINVTPKATVYSFHMSATYIGTK